MSPQSSLKAQQKINRPLIAILTYHENSLKI